MNLRSIDLNLLTVFDAVIAAGNISQAADKIGMSQPAMSAALNRLRLVVKDDLFIRTGRGVKPTPRAQELEKPIRNILEMIENTLIQSEDFNFRESNRIFTITSMDFFGVLILPALIKHMEYISSSITLNLNSSNDSQLINKMRFGDIDFNIDYMQIVSDDFHNTLIFSDTACCLVNKNHPTIDDEMTLENYLAAKQIVLFPYSNRVSIMDEFLNSMDISRRRTMTVPSFLNYPYIVSNTEFICTLPRKVGELYAKQHDLKLFPLPVPDFSVNYYLMWHNSFDNDPAHRWMRDELLKQCTAL